jgi:hypothetical protein
LEGLSEEVKRTSLEAAGDFAAFASWEKFLEDFGDAERFMRWGSGGVSGTHDFESDQTRGYIQWMEGQFCWGIVVSEFVRECSS